ncbi:MAG: Re/Si-specific NAD(P)(+) transhydrogenase subunit alpha [Eggerthellaceae bacterium]|nr:Re/Si-specific NAD(P)(+) transhydrogenase subunit alpha [Eggerthellaceae bacterium]
MVVGVPKEAPGQPLVAATPETVAKLHKLGYEVIIESTAGEHANYYDEAYEEQGARIVTAEEAWKADIVLHLDYPNQEQLRTIRPGATLLCRMDPNRDPNFAHDVARLKITALAIDAIPRLSRAQSMDVRSSMMSISGYRAVIMAAEAFERTFAGQVTAAGKTRPANVYVIGVGVAGLAAIGQAGSMGAQVFATDVRADVADQVESLGGTFVEIPVSQHSADGYARPLTEEEQQQVLLVYADQAAKSDIVITTAQVPGRAAPLLLTEAAVEGMKPGSVIVDMGASPLGGNCALSKPDETVVTENGVTILGPTNLPATMARQASQLYGQNLVNFLKLTTPERDGNMVLDFEDDIVRGITVTTRGQVTWPPPPISVSAAPKKDAKAAEGEKGSESEEEEPQKSAFARHWWKVLLGVLVAALILGAPDEMAAHFVVFALACVVGFYVITGVSHTLHTPLMSVTNAISGIIIVGAILQAAITGSTLMFVFSFIAMAIAAINVFGGFLVTNRMLEMFEKSSE